MIHRLLLSHLLAAWARGRSSVLETVPRPEDAPVARVPGPRSVRVLLVGSGPAAGWGVRSHDLALPGHLARRLASTTGGGAQVDATADASWRVADLVPVAALARPVRYDAVILLTGMNDAIDLTPLPAWRTGLERVLDRLAESAPGAAVLVVGVQPVRSVSVYAGWPGAIADRHRRAMNRVTVEVCGTRGVAHAPLPAPVQPPGRPGHRSPGVFREWAEHLADRVLPLLPASRCPDRGPQPETGRQLAVDALGAEGPALTALDRITDSARRAFGVSAAAVTMLDGDVHRFRSQAGADLGPMPRAWSFCAQTILADEPLVVGDLANDARFDANPLVHGAAGLRFYAGHPIESPDGYRVGALCILDTEPHDPGSVDVRILSALALEAQKELWAASA